MSDDIHKILTPGSPEWIAQRRQMLAQEGVHGTPAWWYLSFAGEEGFLGGVFVWANGFMSAVEKTHALGISPGKAEVRGWYLKPDFDPPPARLINRLLSKRGNRER